MPAYLNLSKKELGERVKKAYQLLEKCRVCPRKCGVNRLKGQKGFCQLAKEPMVSSFHPHFGEEDVLVGRGGSGTIFFTHCNLACLYCQNYDISQLGHGSEISPERLVEMMIELQDSGCHNINLVTPTSQVPAILASLPLAIEKGLKLPLVYNTNAYDSVETLKLLDGIVDIYMPDARYADEEVAIKYSAAPHYPEIMEKALKEMHRQVGDLEMDEDNIAQRGLLVRHLVLPTGLAGTEKIMAFIASEISANTFINIMSQYRPCYKAFDYPSLDRSLTLAEHQEALAIAKKAGLKRIYH